MTGLELNILIEIDSFLKSANEIKMPQMNVFFERLKKNHLEHIGFINDRMQQVNERFVNGYFVPHHSLKSIFKELNELAAEIKPSTEVGKKKKKKKKVQIKVKVPKSQRYEKENKRVREKFEELKRLNAQGGTGTSTKSSIWPVQK